MVNRSFSVEKNVDLAPYNTLQVHAYARYFVRLSSVEALIALLKHPRWIDEPKIILGGGSNVLFVDDFDGLVIKMDITGKEIVKKNQKFVWLKIGAGENWHQTVRYCVQQGWGGIENLSLIPGTVGAAPIQNIGAYGAELEDVFSSLTAVEIATGKQRIFHKDECRFGYRDSIFKRELKNRYVIADVTLRLSLHPEPNTSYGSIRNKLAEKNINNPTITDMSDLIIEIRNKKLPDPAQLANAGSFFKNPVLENKTFKRLKKSFPSMPGYAVGETMAKVPAGWLIEQTGWKGKKINKVGTYHQQALVIVNYGGATSREILQIAQKIKQSVKDKFGVELVPEVNIIKSD
ncbi:MAG TPA: UDP-N-acetylmuramate dehydrogenase [Balneolaceae bacterium]|nr:UDP-N-acetylmuramate dehydrogenase [Balneolaceae bacterium]